MKKEKKLLKGFLFAALTAAGAVVLLILFPDNRVAAINTSWSFLIELVEILPGVMILMGLFAVWVKNETVIKYLGHSSGNRGFALAFFLGMLPSGPLYVAFPMAASLLQKGARVANIIIFLSAWACIKIPQELVEMRFLGVRFMALRLGFTIIMVLAMGLFIEKAGGYRRTKREPNRGV